MKNYCKILYGVLLFFIGNLSYCQVTNFTLQVTATNETCPGNGRLDFSVSNVTSGGTIIYTVYKLPNLVTPIVVTQSNTFTGLVAGDYRVVATQSLPNGNVTTQQIDATILDKITRLQLDFVVTDATCTGGGIITIRTIAGLPQLYEILSGPSGSISQNSNVFSGLSSGNYVLKVTDSCGDYLLQNVTVGYVNPVLLFNSDQVTVVNCNTLDVANTITASVGRLLYPLTVEYTVYDPSGIPSVTTTTITTGNAASLLLTNPIAFYYGQSYRYKIKVTDRCGNVFTSNDIVLNPIMEVSAELFVMSCAEKAIKLTVNKFGVPPFEVSFLSAPTGFVPTVFNNAHPSFSTSPILYYNANTSLPAGNYDIKVTDSCGRIDATSITISSVPLPLPTIMVSQLKGCAEGYSSVSIGANTLSYGIVSATLESAPASYTTTLPLNLDAYLYNSTIYLSNLTSGDYKFKITDNCGNIREVFATITGYHTTSNDYYVNRNCTSFSLEVRNVSNIPSSVAEFWLQKWNSSSNQWVHPITGNTLSSGITVTNALRIGNNSVTNVVNTIGQFRIVKTFSSYKTPTPTDTNFLTKCLEVLGEFDNFWEPKIKDIYSFSCTNNLYQVLVEVLGVAPFRYEIIEKNGIPFYIDNANSSTFNNIGAGVYKFRVTDSCGNQKLRLFEVNSNVSMEITATAFCDGSVGSLSVPYFSYLQYEWWKDNNSTTIISTSNSLQFNTFQSTADVGVYHVRISNPGNPNSCIQFVKEYTILSSLSNPNAGDNNSIIFCNQRTNVFLDSLLSLNHDPNGVWTEISNSGITIVNNYWDATSVPNGTYNFKYRVNGFCGRYDEAYITIKLSSVPPSPIASFDPVICDGGSLNLYASSVVGASYIWNGPNGFYTTIQNPVIANISNAVNGVYTVSVIVDGCESSPNAVTVEVHQNPDYKIVEVCQNGAKNLSVIPNSNNASDSLSSYEWTFPDGTSHTGNPIVIANGQTGQYSVTVQNDSGCAKSGTILIKCTSCGYIPRGVSANGDFKNDNFDLQCLENVKNVKIYNRYGTLVFEKDNYLNEWDGHDIKGNLLPTSTYYYHITFHSGESKTGWVYLNY